MTRIAELKKVWMKDPDFRTAYEGLEEEFTIARELIEARARAGLSQADVAARMRTTQSAVARMESGRQLPSLRTLARYAEATGTRPILRLEPIKRRTA